MTPPSTKGKDREIIALLDDDKTTLERPAPQQTHLWVDLYQPKNLVRGVKLSASLAHVLFQDELAVHKRKVQDVRQWLLESIEGGITGSLRKQRVSLKASYSLSAQLFFFSAFLF